jgi:hypothetical protein
VVAAVRTPLFHDPGRAPARVEITVAVEVSAARLLPLSEYVNRMLSGAFEEVSLRSDLKSLGAVAVRCVSESPFSNRPDEIQSYVVFDLPIRRHRPADASGVVMPEQSPEQQIARYVVAVRGTEDVKERTEELLQRVLLRFEGM